MLDRLAAMAGRMLLLDALIGRLAASRDARDAVARLLAARVAS
jgi:hypothetical protein